MVLEWIQTWPEWVQGVWLGYITLHDFVQWGIMAILARTAWGERQRKKELEEILGHVHDELHKHIEEDASFHAALGQTGMTKGE